MTGKRRARRGGWLFVLLSVGFPALAADPFPGPLPGEEIIADLPAGFEISGGFWHPRLQTLFLADDGGIIASLNLDGTIEAEWSPGDDIEGLALADPSTDLVYYGKEVGFIKEFDLLSGLVTREFWLDVPTQGNNGLEGLTFVPDPDHPEGGLFYAGFQNDGKIRVFELPIRSSSTATDVTLIQTIVPVEGRVDLSGLHYKIATDVLYGIYDSTDRIIAMDTNGILLGEWELPGMHQEAVMFLGCTLFIGQDSGELWSYLFLDDDADDDGDGWLNCEDNCVAIPNPAQADSDSDLLGDPCDCLLDDHCDDGNECNGIETCDLGNHICLPGTPLADDAACGDASTTECSNPDSCLSGVCDPNDEPAGTACGDAVATDCSNPDSCQSGVCDPNDKPAGTACGDGSDTPCLDPDSCDGSGTCLTNDEPDGAACDDGDAGTINDQCTAGECFGVECVTAADCDDDTECTDDICNDNVCENPVSADGTACGSGSNTECTDPDTCLSGTCQSNDTPAGTACGNTADTQCTDPDTCDGSGTCLANNATNGTTCNDGLPCTVDDACSGGTCGGTDNCPNGLSCNQGGQCVVPTVVVFQDDTGYAGTQDSFIREGAPDANHGTASNWEWDTSSGGAPGLSLSLIRFDGILGTGPGQIPPDARVVGATLSIVVSNKSSGEPGRIHELSVEWDEATVTYNNLGGDPGLQGNETGTLIANAPTELGLADIDVTVSLQSWLEDPSTNRGWVFIPMSSDGVHARSREYTVDTAQRPKLSVELESCDSNAECDDGTFCNGVESCVLGLCRSGLAVDCSDGKACNGVETCSNNACQSGTPLNCNDGNPCTDDSCDQQSGCLNEPVNCADGLWCTNDSCNGATAQCDHVVDSQACLIDGSCHADGEPNPADDCEVCSAALPFGWSPVEPPEVIGLVLERSDETLISWPEQEVGIAYDIAGGLLSALHADGGVAGAVCLADDLSDTSWNTRGDPPAGEGFYYLLRSQTSCGAGTYGHTSLGAERAPTDACEPLGPSGAL